MISFEQYYLLRCDTMYSGICSPTFQMYVLPPSSLSYTDDGDRKSSKKVVIIYQTTWCQIPDLSEC